MYFCHLSLLEGEQIRELHTTEKFFFHRNQQSTKRIPAPLNFKKKKKKRSGRENSILRSGRVERKPILTLLTTNSTFHSFYSLSWKLLPTLGNSLESNCQESTALVFGEREGARDGEGECKRRRRRGEEMWRHNR